MSRVGKVPFFIRKKFEKEKGSILVNNGKNKKGYGKNNYQKKQDGFN